MRANSSPCRIARPESHNRRTARGPEIVHDAPGAERDAHAALGRLRRRLGMSAAVVVPLMGSVAGPLFKSATSFCCAHTATIFR